MLNRSPLIHHCRVVFSYIGNVIFAVLRRGVTPLQKAPSSRWGLNAFCQSWDVAFWKGASNSCRRGSTLCVFILLFCLMPVAAHAQMSQLSDKNLSGISGQAGVSIMMDGSMQFHEDSFYFSDTQNWPHPNGIWLINFDISGSSTVGTPFSFATLYQASPLTLEPDTIDVATDTLGNATGTPGTTFVSIFDTSHMTPRWYSIGDIEFQNWNGSSYDPLVSLGSLNLDAVSQGPSLYQFWAHASQGISFDYSTTISASALNYTYSTATPAANSTLSFSGINIAGSATGDPRYPNGYTDNSTDPPTIYPIWGFSGTFKIGMIGDASNAPATIDVATDSGNNTYLSLSLPMAGTVRVADVNFGGQDFGPIAIDNIQVHRLNVKISP